MFIILIIKLIIKLIIILIIILIIKLILIKSLFINSVRNNMIIYLYKNIKI